MESLTLNQADIAAVIVSQYPKTPKAETINFIKNIFGKTATLRDILTAYNYINA